MSLISDIVNDAEMPIFDDVESALGCETFLFRAKTEKACWDMYYAFLNSVANNKQVKAYRIGLRPDYPVPVARFFLEICVDDPMCYPIISLWTTAERGRLSA